MTPVMGNILSVFVYYLAILYGTVARPLYRSRVRRLRSDLRLDERQPEMQGSNLNFCLVRNDGTRYIAKVENPLLRLYHSLRSRSRVSLGERVTIVQRLRTSPVLAHAVPETFAVGDCVVSVLIDGAMPLSGYRIGSRTEGESIGQQLKTIMSAWHEAGFVHGDLKIQNILIKGGKVGIVDFDDVQPLTDLSLRSEEEALEKILEWLANFSDKEDRT